MIFRAHKDLKTAKANLDIDEGISYTVAYLGMLHAARAFILLKGFRPADGYQHKTVVEFMSHFLGREFKVIVEQFCASTLNESDPLMLKIIDPRERYHIVRAIPLQLSEFYPPALRIIDPPDRRFIARAIADFFKQPLVF